MNKQKALDKVKTADKAQRSARLARHAAITAARNAGATWDEIGAVLGMSKQAASQLHKRG